MDDDIPAKPQPNNGYGSIPNAAFYTDEEGVYNVERNDRYIQRIRQQAGRQPISSRVNFLVARSRRRPIIRTKSEPDFNALVDEDVEAIRDKLVKRYGKRHDRFLIKKVPKFTRKQWMVLASISLVDFTSFCAMSILAPFFPSEAAAKGVSASVSGFVFSVYALVVFLASPLMGTIVGQVGPKFLLILGIILSGCCNLLFGVLDKVDSTPVFITYCFLVRTFEALGAAAFATSSYTFVAKVFPDNVGAVLGILETFVGLGLAVGPAVGGLLYDLGGYSLPFYTLGGVMLLTIPVNLILLPNTDKEEEPPERPGKMWKLVKIPPILIISFVVIIASSTWGFLDPTLSIHLSEFNLSAKELGLFFLLNSFLYAATCPLWGYVADRIQRTWLMMFFGLLLNTVGLILLGPSPILPLQNSIWINIVALIILGTSVAMTLLPTFEAILDLALDAGYSDDTSTYGLIAGLWSSVYSLGEFFGPSLGGFLLETYDFPISSTVMACFSFALAIFVLIYFSSIQSPYESQISASSKDRTTEVDSGISDNEHGRGITSRSSSTATLTTSSSSSGCNNEATPLLISQSYEDCERSYEQRGMENSYGSIPDILKTASITGAGAIEL